MTQKGITLVGERFGTVIEKLFLVITKIKFKKIIKWCYILNNLSCSIIQDQFQLPRMKNLGDSHLNQAHLILNPLHGSEFRLEHSTSIVLSESH